MKNVKLKEYEPKYLRKQYNNYHKLTNKLTNNNTFKYDIYNYTRI